MAGMLPDRRTKEEIEENNRRFLAAHRALLDQWIRNNQDTVLMMRRPTPPSDPRPEKRGNLYGEVPLDVPYAGCQHLDCIPGCDISKGHCQRLEDAFREAGYYHLIAKRE